MNPVPEVDANAACHPHDFGFCPLLLLASFDFRPPLVLARTSQRRPESHRKTTPGRAGFCLRLRSQRTRCYQPWRKDRTQAWRCAAGWRFSCCGLMHRSLAGPRLAGVVPNDTTLEYEDLTEASVVDPLPTTPWSTKSNTLTDKRTTRSRTHGLVLSSFAILEGAS